MIAELWITLDAMGGLARSGLMAGVEAWSGLALRRYAGRRFPDESFRVRTADGWNLPVIRYRPLGLGRRWKEPIILCHGLAATSWSLDLSESASLARYLAAHGFDVFLPDLRGPNPSVLRSGSTGEDGGEEGLTFDEHTGYDAPAILNAVLERTGARRAFWVGHSMGGMIGYVLAARDPRLAGLVTLASPVEFHPDQLLGRLMRLALRLPFDPLPQRQLGLALAPIVTETFPPIPEYSALREHLDLDTLRLVLANGVGDMPQGILRQFAEWGLLERMADAQGNGDYRELLPKVRLPLLVVAANADRLAPPDAVRPGFEHAISGDKSWLCLGGGEGEPELCGHADIVLGRYAPTAVFPKVSGWLEDRATKKG